MPPVALASPGMPPAGETISLVNPPAGAASKQSRQQLERDAPRRTHTAILLGEIHAE